MDSQQVVDEVQLSIGKIATKNLTKKQGGETHEEDYFSFFSSSERLLLKPETSFKGIREHISELPTDHCILFESGFDKMDKSSMFSKSNYVYVTNLPVLQKVDTYFKNSSKVRQVTYKDLVNCKDKRELNDILTNRLTCNELIKHLSARYG
jgi:hypothetical protein